MSTTEGPHKIPVAWLDAPETGARAAAPPPVPRQRSGAPSTSTRGPSSPRWQGWAFFGACIMALGGLFQAVLGLVALFDRSYFTLRTNDLLLLEGYRAWGWVHLIAGAVALAAGLGVVLSGRAWSRYTAIAVAGLSAIVNLGFLAASPAWSALVISLDVVVIYALAVHGWEVERS